MSKNERQNSLLSRIFASGSATDARKGIHKCADGFCCSLSSLAKVGESASDLSTDLTKAWLSSLNGSFEKNLSLSSEWLKCKNIDDFIAFQKIAAEKGFSNMFELYGDFSEAFQNYLINKTKIASDYFDKTLTVCFGGKE